MLTTKRLRKIAWLPLVIVFCASLVLSWNGLTALGMMAGFGRISWLLPLVIDGAVIAGAFTVITATETLASTKFGWWLMLGGAVVSVWGNVAASSGHGFAGALTHALAPLAMALVLEAWLRTVRLDIAREQEAAEKAAQEAAEQERRQKAAQRRQERAETPASPQRTEKSPSKRARASKVDDDTLTRMREAVENLDPAVSLTQRTRVALSVANVSGSVLADVLGVSVSQAYKAKERANRVSVAS